MNVLNVLEPRGLEGPPVDEGRRSLACAASFLARPGGALALGVAGRQEAEKGLSSTPRGSRCLSWLLLYTQFPPRSVLSLRAQTLVDLTCRPS